MEKTDIRRVVSLYLDANTFATKENISKWTLEGLLKYPLLNLVAEKNSNIVGAVSGILRKNIGVINDIAVKNNYRNQKIGNLLFQKILNKFKKLKVQKITLWVHFSNIRAIPFYYRFGFKIKRISTTKNIKFVPNGEQIFHLEKRL
ncbi:MAG TPA: GNAT family N-acetyltransferase [Candidatus Paceibacterota bacterium]